MNMPDHLTTKKKSHQHLNLEERREIQTLYDRGHSMRQISLIIERFRFCHVKRN